MKFTTTARPPELQPLSAMRIGRTDALLYIGPWPEI